MRLLLVEDDARISRFVAKGLREQAYAVDVANTGDDALYQAAINTYDLVILDVMIPGRNGFEVCRELRKSGQRMPILMLTARDAVEDRVAGLNPGADDYLTKPFAMTELIARVKALLRRPGGVLGITLEAGNVSLDTVGRELTVAGAPVRLARQELAILEQMMRRFGRIVPKAVLEEKLYGIDEEPDSNPIPVHVHHLRRQLEAASASLAIHTIRGIGYILDETKG